MYHTILDIKRANKAAGRHFFDPNAMAFFNSRIRPYVWRGDGASFFVTSEHDGDRSPRYTVRRFDHTTHDVRTVGDFRAYATTVAAYDAARDAAVASHSDGSILSAGGTQ